MPNLDLDGLHTTYEIVRSARRTIGVIVGSNGKVVIRVPHNASMARIIDSVERSKPWILKHVIRHRQACPTRSFVSGENLLYLGKGYRLMVIEGGAETLPVLEGDDLKVWVVHGLDKTTRCEAVKRALVGWYEAQAQQILPERLDALALRVGRRPTAVKVKYQQRRWGTCSAKGVINLNWQLIMTPLEVIDYVIVHELCHLMIHNHQREFWNCVARYVPDYGEHREWLRVNSRALNFLSV